MSIYDGIPRLRYSCQDICFKVRPLQRENDDPGCDALFEEREELAAHFLGSGATGRACIAPIMVELAVDSARKWKESE